MCSSCDLHYYRITQRSFSTCLHRNLIFTEIEVFLQNFLTSSTLQRYALNIAHYSFVLRICSEGLFFLNAAFDITILDLISRVYLESFDIKQHQQCKNSPSSGCLRFIISCVVNDCHLILNTSGLIKKFPFQIANRFIQYIK